MKLEDQPNIIPNFLKGLLIEQYGEQISNNIINGYTCKRESSFRVNTLKSTVKEIKEVLDKSSEDIDLSYDITVDEFVSDLFERYPSINSKKFQIAINEEFVKGDDIVKPNDTVALIPPVSGG